MDFESSNDQSRKQEQSTSASIVQLTKNANERGAKEMQPGHSESSNGKITSTRKPKRRVIPGCGVFLILFSLNLPIHNLCY